MSWFRRRDDATRDASNETFSQIGELQKIQSLEGTLASLFERESSKGEYQGYIENPHIILKPPENADKSLVCLLGLSWNLSAEIWEMSLYLHLFGKVVDSQNSFWHLGYRLEMPHKNGDHDYTHVQPIRAFGYKSARTLSFMNQSIPQRFPTIPIRGTTLTELCASIGWSLHGRDAGNRIRNSLKGNRYLAAANRLVNL